MARAIQTQAHQDPLWVAFETINAYYAKSPQHQVTKETTLLFITCMLKLLEQLGNDQLSASEKNALHIAKSYWLEGAQELEPQMLSLNNKIESKIDYQNSVQDNRQACITQVLSIDKDHLHVFRKYPSCRPSQKFYSDNCKKSV